MIYEDTSAEALALKNKIKSYWAEGTAALKHRKAKWKRNYSYWINRQLSETRPAYKSDLRLNYCFVTTQVKVPILTQNEPTVNFVPYNPDDQQEAEARSKLVGNALWNKLKIMRTYQHVVWSSAVYDDGFYKVCWDPDAEEIGEIYVTSVEPFKLVPDPMARYLETCRYVFHIEPYAISDLKVLYPKFAEKIAADDSIGNTELFEERRAMDRTPSHMQMPQDRPGEVAIKKEVWLTANAFDAELQEGEGDTKTKRGKYPHGLIVTMIGDDLIVEVKENKYPWPNPFVKAAMNEIGDEFWGMGDVEQVIPLQDGLNHVSQQIDDLMNKTANVGWTINPAVGEESIRKLAAIINRPGVLKPIRPGDLVADIPPQVPAGLFRLADSYKQAIFDITGISEILQGSGRVTHRTARGIERLFEAGTSRIGQSVRNHEHALREVYLKMNDLVSLYYTEERTFAIIGGHGQLAGSLKYEPKKVGRFEASIDSGATLPADKKSRAELALELYKMGVLERATAPDPVQKEIARVVLDAVEFPGRERLLSAVLAPAPQPQPEPLAPAGPPPPSGGLPPEIEQMAAQAGIPVQELLAMLSGQPPAAPAVMAPQGV